MNDDNTLNRLIGIDIGGTKCAVILGGFRKDKCPERKETGPENKTEPLSIDILDRISFPTHVEKGCEYTLTHIEKAIGEMVKKHKLTYKDISGIGISCGGPLDSKKGIILSPPNLIGWDNIPIVKRLEQKFGVKTQLQNDANACALAEWQFGAAHGCRNAVFLTFGTGMGAGLILDGRLYGGTNDMAGEVGHIRLNEYGPVGYGKAGSFEGFCSGGGIAQLARTKVLEQLQKGEPVSFCKNQNTLDQLTAKVVGDAAEAGDALALEIYRLCGQYLGKGLSILIDLLNPEVIVIGSIFARSRDLLWPAAKEVIERESLCHSLKECRVVPAALGEKIGDYAALATAITS